MQPCTCGGREFEIDAVYTAKDRVRLADDGSGDFDIIDTFYEDGEWGEHSTVRCIYCGKEMLYGEWSKQEDGNIE